MATIIYQPKGKANEYSPWAANFYNGCSNRCDYCYNRHCQAKSLLGKDKPTLKKALIDEPTAIKIFLKELELYKDRILADKKGLFFNFVSDPMLPETRLLNIRCILESIKRGVPCVILTKCADWYSTMVEQFCADDVKNIELAKRMLKIGFTLTGRDDMEHGNSSNYDRIHLMKILHDDGYRTWASIEPVVNVYDSLIMVQESLPYCNSYKVGLLSGKKGYTKDVIKWMMTKLKEYNAPIIYKDSVYKFIE